jgi:hypothetical protein
VTVPHRVPTASRTRPRDCVPRPPLWDTVVDAALWVDPSVNGTWSGTRSTARPGGIGAVLPDPAQEGQSGRAREPMQSGSAWLQNYRPKRRILKRIQNASNPSVHMSFFPSARVRA